MKCPKCAFLNDELNRTCSQCGEPFDSTPSIGDATPIAAYPADLVLSPGESFGNRYQIIEQIGAGGMGRVFKALDKELQIVVVLKVINPELNDSPDAVERFKRELLLAREIVHENVIRIHDLGEVRGIRYISMNYVEGQNLQELISMAGPLSLEKVLDIISKVCRALVTAHAQGIIHRDLKPQNVMIGKKGIVTVLDFGIARSLNQTGTTRTGIVIGTPECMAPEQIQGEKVDASTDIYSLGVMMYQMVTGRSPFVAETTQALLFKHLHETPLPPSSLNPAIPASLERIILKCLEKNPGRRYAAVEKLLKKIDRLLKKKTGHEKNKQRLFFLFRPLRLRPLVYLGRLLELLILLFVCGTLLGWFLDYHYGNKLQRLTAEYPAYFNTRFPMDKDYLPEDWPARQGDAWQAYRRVMFAQAAPYSGAERRLNLQMEKLYRTAIIPSGLDGVKQALDDSGAKMDHMIPAIAGNHLAPKPGEPLAAAFVASFSRWQALKARLAFLEGDIAGGVERLRQLGYFLLDCEAAAGGMLEHARAIGQFRIFCREVVPLVLASDIDLARKQLEKIEPLLLLFLEKMSGQRFFQMAYLDDLQAVRQENFNDSWWTGPGYFWFGRFRLLADRSTRNIQLFRTLAAESRARNELNSISRQAEMSKFLARFRHDDGKDWPRVGSAAFYRLQNSFRTTRTLIKLALLLERLQRFGANGNEVIALLVSDLGMNDLSGESWKITQAAEKNIVHLSERMEFSIRPIAYATDHAVVIAEWQKIAAAIDAMSIPPEPWTKIN
ncbi:MAG: serine/threonine-protein kinase [Candidatus Aminicenantes bacterium]|nr:serine/threonine-protein kinase [Candidatus Aminicenantes bacterium]